MNYLQDLTVFGGEPVLLQQACDKGLLVPSRTKPRQQ
jgi:hypothetical protein